MQQARATGQPVARGRVPLKVGRDILVKGRLQHGTFVSDPDSIMTKCPSKYTAKKE